MSEIMALVNCHYILDILHIMEKQKCTFKRRDESNVVGPVELSTPRSNNL